MCKPSLLPSFPTSPLPLSPPYRNVVLAYATAIPLMSYFHFPCTYFSPIRSSCSVFFVFPHHHPPPPCSVVLAYATAISIMSYFYLVSGFFVTRKQMPNTLIWLHYISPFKYSYEALAMNQFD
ncbi:unnamed protein product, partial [Closterium sp. NIES-53]